MSGSLNMASIEKKNGRIQNSQNGYEEYAPGSLCPIRYKKIRKNGK